MKKSRPKKTNIKSKGPRQFTPVNKNYRLQIAKGSYKSGLIDPTIDTPDDFLNTDDINYELPEDSYNYERPSERRFSYENYLKPLLITLISAIIIGIGGLIFRNHTKISVIETINERQNKDIESNKNSIGKAKDDIEELKAKQKLNEYRIDQLERINK